jgi:hypothetical protein
MASARLFRVILPVNVHDPSGNPLCFADATTLYQGNLVPST